MNQKERWNQLKKEYNQNENIEIIDDIEEEYVEKIPMTEEEKIKIKKQMMIIVWIIVLIIIGIVMFSLLSVRMNNKNNKQNQISKENNLKEPLPNGEIDISNTRIKEIDEKFDFNINNPLYEKNIIKLFNDEKTEIQDYDFETKMFLITSHEIFTNYMLKETNLKEYQTKEVTITKNKLEELSYEIFGKNITLEHNDFKYFYKKDDKVVYFDVTLDGDKYIFTETNGNPSRINVYMELDYAYKMTDILETRYKVLFINENGIYKDKEMTQLLTSDVNSIKEQLYKAKTYQFNYFENENFDYILNDIELSSHEIKMDGE